MKLTLLDLIIYVFVLKNTKLEISIFNLFRLRFFNWSYPKDSSDFTLTNLVILEVLA